MKFSNFDFFDLILDLTFLLKFHDFLLRSVFKMGFAFNNRLVYDDILPMDESCSSNGTSEKF